MCEFDPKYVDADVYSVILDNSVLPPLWHVCKGVSVELAISQQRIREKA